LSLALLADGVENPANLARLEDAARLLGVSLAASVEGRLIAVENVPGAREVFGLRPLKGDATLAVGNERRGLSRATLAAAAETVAIPTQSRTVTTLNVAAAAAVAAWYVQRGSGPQARTARPELRRPALLVAGHDHVEVGSSLRSAAAFGFRDVLLDDRGAGWFDGPAAVRREARAAARRHKNALRIHRATLDHAARFEEVVVVVPSGRATPIQRERLTRGRRQVVVVGVPPEEADVIAPGRVRVASLGLQPVPDPPLRLVASVLMAEVSRQVGRRRPVPGQPAPRAPRYDAALELTPGLDAVAIDASELLMY
jgi:tRNA G18 (ribose-2'-O)-methylase SpoU